MFPTIIAGIIIFVVSQFVLKLALEPIVELKKVLGEVSALFLREQASIVNCNASEGTKYEIMILSSKILSMRQAIIFYRFFSIILGMPSKRALLKGCHSLNLISYMVVPEAPNLGQRKSYREVHEEMKLVSKFLKIQIRYS
ncbi:hypothetical protein [Psychrobacter frigidicola]|uniref:hypothetical protein n=1 Tax=Psychrobacter frigidicola TaxID=45611 RepID=UPI0019195544|nr:hypothetical protein [Psychrobacter frigidicola]